jgi:hypothetical protein
MGAAAGGIMLMTSTVDGWCALPVCLVDSRWMVCPASCVSSTVDGWCALPVVSRSTVDGWCALPVLAFPELTGAHNPNTLQATQMKLSQIQ